MTVKNTFRLGSTCHRAFHHLELHGRCSTAQLARALEYDEDELPGLLGLALRSGHIRRSHDDWVIGDGTPLDAPATPPAPPAPPAINTATVPPAVREIPPAAPPRPAASGARQMPAAKKAAAAAAPKPEVSVATGVDIDRVHIGKLPVSVRPPKPEPESAKEAGPASPLMAAKAVLEEQKNRSMSAAVALIDALVERAETQQAASPAPATADRMLAAWCSDGTYLIEKDGSRVELNLGEVVELFDHLCSVVAGIER